MTSVHTELLARCTFPSAGTAVTCAVSGGADSLALLVLACEVGLDVTAVHVDHGLRPGSGAEAAVVAAAAARFGAAFRGISVSVAPGPNLEARARAARYAALPAGVLTGHTLDDQAETVLLNLLRGSGPDGLAGMRTVGRTGVRRPLLGLRRAETVALCAELGLVPVVDPSNADPTHRRNRIRRELLPLLDDLARRDVAALLAREADVWRADADWLDAAAEAIDPTDARALTAAPPPLARRAVRRWIRSATSGPPPDLAGVERVLAVARGDAVACELAGGWTVRRHHQALSVARR